MAETRATLEAEHKLLLERLHRRSDDFDASNRLKQLITALQGLAYPVSEKPLGGKKWKPRKPKR